MAPEWGVSLGALFRRIPVARSGHTATAAGMALMIQMLRNRRFAM